MKNYALIIFIVIAILFSCDVPVKVTETYESPVNETSFEEALQNVYDNFVIISLDSIDENWNGEPCQLENKKLYIFSYEEYASCPPCPFYVVFGFIDGIGWKTVIASTDPDVL